MLWVRGILWGGREFAGDIWRRLERHLPNADADARRTLPVIDSVGNENPAGCSPSAQLVFLSFSSRRAQCSSSSSSPPSFSTRSSPPNAYFCVSPTYLTFLATTSVLYNTSPTTTPRITRGEDQRFLLSRSGANIR